MAQERYQHPAEGQKIGVLPEVQPYALNWGLACAAGFVATIVITLMMYFVPPMIGMPPMDIGKMLGTMLLPQDGTAAFWVGMLWHFINGIVFVLIYAGVLLALRKQSTAGSGAVFGIVLWLLAMTMMPAMLSMHPLVRAGEMQNPGVFMLKMGGWTPAIFDLVGHLVYGVIAGLIYKHAHRPTS
jgi:uncharacterized membrane protein YagU involved in acid resistance